MRKRIHITLSPEMLEELDDSCTANGTSRSAEIELGLGDFLCNACAGCGVHFPGLWMVPTRVWRYYVTRPFRKRILCLACWNDIVAQTDNGSYQDGFGRPVATLP